MKKAIKLKSVQSKIHARLESCPTTMTRVVPIVACDVYFSAESEFFERHPGTEAVIDDWHNNVLKLIVGPQQFNNIEHAC